MALFASARSVCITPRRRDEKGRRREKTVQSEKVEREGAIEGKEGVEQVGSGTTRKVAIAVKLRSLSSKAIEVKTVSFRRRTCALQQAFNLPRLQSYISCAAYQYSSICLFARYPRTVLLCVFLDTRGMEKKELLGNRGDNAFPDHCPTEPRPALLRVLK